jgi:hypothetical protein
VAIRLKELSRDLYAIYSRREDELEEAGDWDGTTLLTTTDEDIIHLRYQTSKSLFLNRSLLLIPKHFYAKMR